MAAQKSINAAAGIGIQPQAADFSTDRAAGIANRLATTQNFDDIDWLLQEPIVNFSRGVVDDVLKTNAEFHSNSGLHPVIVRQSTGKCCEWCDAIAGTYKYPDNVPKVIYSRHDNCRCSVDYKPDKHSKTVQNVHSKQWTDEETLEKRKTVGLRQHTATETKAEREKVGLLGADKHRPTVDISGNGGIIKSGGISGAKKRPDGKNAMQIECMRKYGIVLRTPKLLQSTLHLRNRL